MAAILNLVDSEMRVSKSSAHEINRRTIESIASNITDTSFSAAWGDKGVVLEFGFSAAKVMPKDERIYIDMKSICYCNNYLINRLCRGIFFDKQLQMFTYPRGEAEDR